MSASSVKAQAAPYARQASITPKDSVPARRRKAALTLAIALICSVAGGVMATTGTDAQAASGLANYDKIIYFTDVRWWSDATPGDGICATPATLANGGSVPNGGPNSACTLLAAVQEANAWSAAHPSDRLLITPADATMAGSLTGYNPWNNPASSSSWTLQQANWAIAPLTTGYGNYPVQTAVNGLPAFGGMLSSKAASVAALGNIGSDDTDGSVTMLYVTANNLTIDLQNRVGFWIYTDTCNAFPGSTGNTCSTIWGFNGQNQTLQNFGTRSTATQTGAGAGLYMLNSEDNVVVGQNARNFILRNGYIGNPHNSTAANSYSNERGVVIIGGAQNVTVDSVVFDGLAMAGLGFEPRSTDTSATRSVIDGVTITNSTFQMDSRYDYGNSGDAWWWIGSGIVGLKGSSAYAPPTVNNLVIQGNNFRNFTMGAVNWFDSGDNWSFNNEIPIDMQGFRTSGTSTIQSNMFTIDLPIQSGIYQAGRADGRAMILVAGVNSGTLTISQNTFTHSALANPQFYAIALDTTPTVGGQGPISGVTIVDNTIANWGTTSYGTGIYARSTNSSYPVSYTAYRNTFPGSVDGGTIAMENDYGSDAPAPIDNYGGSLTAGPVNSFITTWYPTSASANGSALNITVQAPTGGNGNAPVYPVNVDVYSSTIGSNGLAQYVGQITIPSAVASASANLPFVGNPSTVRVQTRDANGNSSQMSRTLAVSASTDTTPPMLWMDRSSIQQATTSTRTMSFVLASSEPLTGGSGAITPSMITNSGTAGAFSSVQVTPATSGSINLTWYVSVQVSNTGTAIPQIAAGVVTDLAGLPNAAVNSVGILNPNDGLQYTGASFLGSLNNDGLGYPITALPGADTVTYVAPLSLSSDALITLNEAGPTTDDYIVSLLTNALGTAAVPPTAYIYLSAENAVVTPDPTVMPLTPAETWSALPSPASTDIAVTAPNLAAIGHSDPYGDTAAHPDTMWGITPTYVWQGVDYTAIDNAIVDGTRTVTFDLLVYSADPNYDGLYLPGISATVLDNDGPASSSSITTTVDNAPADNSSTDTVVVTVLNQAGNPLRNALVTVSVPRNVNVASTTPPSLAATTDPSTGVTTVTVVTGADGLITLALRSGVGGAYSITATGATKADNSDAVQLGTSATVNFASAPIDASQSSFVVSAAQVPADGSTSATITVDAETSAGFPATGQAAHLSAAANPSGNVTVGAFTEVDAVNQPGIYTAPVTSTLVGAKTITVAVDSTTPIAVSIGDNDKATFVAGAVATGAVSIDNLDYVSVDFSTGHVILVTLEDADGNRVPGVAASLSGTASPASGVTIGAFTEADSIGAPGVYAATVTSTSSGSKEITVSYSGLGAGAITPTVFANFVAGAVDPANSTWAVTPSGTLPADGTTAFTGTVTLRDQYSNPTRGISVTFNAPIGVIVQHTTGITATDGTVTATFASPAAGQFTVSATANAAAGSFTVGSSSIEFVAGLVDPSKTTLSVTNDGKPVTGGVHTATVTARDSSGNPVSGQVIIFSVGAGAIGGIATPSATSATTDANGVALITITSADADTYPVSATVNTVAVMNSPQNILFVPGAAVAQDSALVVSTTTPGASSVLADGSQSWTLTVTLEDALGNVVPNATVDFTADAGADLSSPFATTNGSGVAFVTVTSTAAGTYQVHGLVAAADVKSSPGTVTFVAGPPDAAHSSIVASPAIMVADGVAVHTVTITVRDAYGNLVAGATPGVTADPALTQKSVTNSGVTDASGQVVIEYTATVPSTGSGYQVSAAVGAPAQLIGSVGLQYQVGPPDLAKSTVTLSSTSATVGDSVTVTATVRDGQNNPISGVTVDFTASNSGSLSNATCITGTSGVCTVTVSDVVPETVAVDASITAGALTNSPVSVAFVAGALSGSRSVFSVAMTDPLATAVVADGTSSWTATLSAYDSLGNPLKTLTSSDIVFDLSSADPNISYVSVSAPVTNNGDGTYSVLITSTKAISPTVTLTYQSASIWASQPIAFVAGAPDAGHSTLAIPTTTSIVGTPVAATATILDANDNPVSGVIVTFSVSGSGSLSAASCLTGSDGTCTVDVNDLTAETVYVAATILQGSVPTEIGASPETIDFTPGTPNAANSTLEIDQSTPEPVGGSLLLTVTVYGIYGNIVTTVNDPLLVVFSCPTNSTCGPVTGSAGVFTTTITSNVAAYYQVTATYDGSPVGAPTTVTAIFVPGPAANIAVSPTTQTVTAGSTASIDATVSDSFGNLINAATVTGTVNGSASMTTAICITDIAGTCTLEVGDSVVEAVTVGVTSGTATASAGVTFGAGAPSAATSTLVLASASSAAGTPVAATATVKDAIGNVVSGVTVTFSVTGNGSLSSLTCVSLANGMCSVNVNDTTAESVQVAATILVGGNPTNISGSPASCTFTAGPASAATSTLVLASASSTAGTAVAATATVKDANNNLVSGATVNFAVSGNGSLSAASCISLTDGTCSVTVNDATAESVLVSATILVGAAQTDIQGSPATLTFTAGVPSAATSILSLASTSSVVGTPVAATATVKDAYGNVVSGVQVTFGVSSGSLSTSTCVSATNGTCSVSVNDTTAEVVTVTATIDVGGTPTAISNSPSTVTFNSGPPSATNSTLVLASTSSAAGTAVAATATVRDAMGDPLSGVTVSFSVSGNGTLSVASCVSTVTGICSVNVNDAIAESVQVSATIVIGGANTNISGSPASLTFTAGAPSATTSTLALASTSSTAGTAVAATATVKDALGNVVSGVTVSFSVTGSASLSTATCVSVANGTCSVNVNDTTAESVQVAATILVGGNPTNISGSPASLMFTAGVPSAATSSLALTSASSTAGTAVAATATVRDANNNPVSGVAVTFSVSGNGTLSAATCISATNGTCSVNVNDTTAESVLVSATISVGGVQTAIQGSPATLTFTAGAPSASHSTLAIDTASTVPVGSTHTLTVTVMDQYLNVVTSANDPSQVVFSCPTGSTCVVPTGANGVFTTTITSNIATNHSVTATYAASPIGAPTTVIARFAAGPAASITPNPASQTVPQGTQASITVQVVDTYGNRVNAATVTGSVGGSATMPARTISRMALASDVLGAPGGTAACTTNTSGECVLKVTDGVAETVQVAIASGAASTTASVTFEDKTPPPAPVVDTANATEVSGTGEPGDTVTVTWPDGTTTDVVVGPDGKWTIPTPPGTPSGTITVTETDPAGNMSPPTLAPIDTDVPSAPVVDTANETEVSGTGEPGNTVTVTWPDGTTTDVVVGPDGKWVVPTPPGTPSGTISVTQTDPAGNTSPPTTVTIDTDVPSAPVVDTANETEVSGTGEPGNTVTVTWPDGTTTDVVVGPDGKWVVPTPPGTPSGTISVTQTDPAGNTSPPTTVTIGAVPAPSITTANATEVVGTGTPGNMVTVTWPDGTTTHVVVGADGKWSIPTPPGMPPGEIFAIQTDPSGKASGPAEATLASNYLPNTGSWAADAGAVGVLSTLLGGGILLMLARRRSRDTERGKA